MNGDTDLKDFITRACELGAAEAKVIEPDDSRPCWILGRPVIGRNWRAYWAVQELRLRRF